VQRLGHGLQGGRQRHRVRRRDGGTEVLGQNRGRLLNSPASPTTNFNFPPNPNPTQRNHQPTSVVPVKRPSAKKFNHQIFIEENGTLPQATTTEEEQTTLPKNRLFFLIIGIIFLPARKFICYAGVPSQFSLLHLTIDQLLFQPIDLCFVSMFFSKNSTFLLKVLHSAQKNY